MPASLHYHANSAVLEDGDLLLIDAGCEYQLLRLRHHPNLPRQRPLQRRSSAPCTRSCSRPRTRRSPAAGRAITGTIRTTRPCSAITQGLVRLGLLKGRVPALIKDGDYRRFFMHRTGHWLGMDVHDVGDYKVGDEWRVLEPGMCLTVEPGIYIPAGSKGVPTSLVEHRRTHRG